MAQFGLKNNIPRMQADLKRYQIEYNEWFLESSLHDSGYVAETVGLLTEKDWTYEQDGALWLKTAELLRQKHLNEGKTPEQVEKLDLKDARLNQKDEKITELKEQIEEMKRSRAIELNEAGSIAEAAIRINGVFEAAQKAAEQYLMNVRELSERENRIPFEPGRIAGSRKKTNPPRTRQVVPMSLGQAVSGDIYG